MKEDDYPEREDHLTIPPPNDPGNCEKPAETHWRTEPTGSKRPKTPPRPGSPGDVGGSGKP